MDGLQRAVTQEQQQKRFVMMWSIRSGGIHLSSVGKTRHSLRWVCACGWLLFFTCGSADMWPFPKHPPVPWTAKQIKEYAQQQRQQLPESPL